MSAAVRWSPLGFVALLSSCAAGGEPPAGARSRADAGPPPTFIDVQVAIHGSGCTESGCHGPTGKGGMDLVEDPWTALVGAKATGCSDGRMRVVPGKPEASYLIHKLRGRKLCSGKRMPFGCDDTPERPCLTDERIELFEAWIRAGALPD